MSALIPITAAALFGVSIKIWDDKRHGGEIHIIGNSINDRFVNSQSIRVREER
jgi:hypothetical protein